ncbi:MAG: replication initiator protein [Microviridae sp.]|nr:MAG: replication initiator protein [Microviridae sp.]
MCLSPITMTRTYCGLRTQQWVPCGKCEECIKDKQNEYVIRTIEEAMKVKGNIYFLTLTYSDANVPLAVDPDGELIDEDTGEVLSTLKSLDNRDITLWKKRCTRSIYYHSKRSCKFSYLICGEYGPQTHRPHYHGLFIGISPEDMEVFKKDWEKNYGFTCVKQISRFDIERTARYVAKYITKVKSLEDENVKNGKVVKPRKISSKGYGMPSKERWHRMKVDVMGEDYTVEDLKNLTEGPGKSVKKVCEVVNKISKSMKYKNNGREYKLPRYYRQKMFYAKDCFGKMRSTTISFMVSNALQRQAQSDYSRKLVEMATRMHAGESFEEKCRVAAHLQDVEEATRQSRGKAIFETNITALRKSIF